DIWKIPNVLGERVTLIKGKDVMRQFRSTLRKKKYVYKDEPSDKAKGKTPFKDYNYLNRQPWESFVTSVDTEEWKDDVSILDWSPTLKGLFEDTLVLERIRARLNSVTKLYELGEDLISNGELSGTLKLLLRDEGSYPTKDVVMEMLGKGRKHTGPKQC
ncbi:LOW QUALITY PROTEIN: hypothetical protein M8C21_000061, partial [Ambrosia artemisiifolia]